MINDTIVAQCTPSGPGAIALIRVSGPQAVSIVTNIAQLSSKKNLLTVETHTIHHGWIVNNQQIIDEVLFFVMHGPKTFTGEHTVEITCHNNPFIIENIIQAMLASGARLAHPGEFSRQAVENGKMDIIQAESIKELIHAQSQEALKRSLQQVKGSLSSYLKELEQPMVKAIGLCEASFEFLEEDVDFSSQLNNLLEKISADIYQLTVLFDQQKQIREGIRIALVGTVNAGKSSLFNALLGKNRAIVTNIAGTTRDVIESSFYMDGLYCTLLDTAGLRTTNDIIEQQGIERSYQEADLADIVLVVIDQTRNLSPEEITVYQHIMDRHPQKCIIVLNKIDAQHNILLPKFLSKHIPVSAQTGKGISELKTILSEKITELTTHTSSAFLINKRQATLLSTVLHELQTALSILKTAREYELISLHIQKALSILSELSGKTISEQALDAIFKEFCVGK